MAIAADTRYMSERTDQLSKSRDSEVDAGSFDESLLDDSTERREPDPSAESSDGSRFAEYFAPKMFLVVFALLAVLGQLGSTFVPLVGGPLGVFVGAFVVGLASSRRRYGESLVAGGLVGALGVLIGNITLAAVTSSMLTLTGVGAGTGIVLGLLGVYFGRDLRNGLTEDI